MSSLGEAVLFPLPCQAPKRVLTLPRGQGAVSSGGMEGGEHPLVPLTPGHRSSSGEGEDGPPLSSPTPHTVPVPPCGKGANAHHCPQEALALARLENCTGAILRLPAQGLEACHDLLLSYALFY